MSALARPRLLGASWSTAAVGWLWVLALVGCESIPDGVTRVTRRASALNVASDLRFELVPPVKLPTQKGGRSRTRIWLELPPGALVDVASTDDGRADPGRADGGGVTFVFPIGAVLDRVEEVVRGGAWHIADVRGATVTSRGQDFHLYRPDTVEDDGPAAEAVMWGYAWPRERRDLQAWAHGQIADELAAGRGLEHLPEARRAVVAAGVRERGDCLGCHEASRPDDLGPGALVHRGTDASGFHVPRTLFGGDTPLERYRPHDPNSPSPYLVVDCGGEPGTERVRDGARRWGCGPGGAGRVPVARLDLAAALAAGDRDAKRVCESRATLARHLTDRARRAVSAALAECDIKE